MCPEFWVHITSQRNVQAVLLEWEVNVANIGAMIKQNAQALSGLIPTHFILMWSVC